LIRGNFGGQWSFHSDVVACNRAPRLTSRHSIDFFADKVANERSSTSVTPFPACSRVRAGVSFRAFSTVTIDDILNAVRLLPDKPSAAVPIRTSVLKQIVDPSIYTVYSQTIQPLTVSW
jgi:hypothetical protein